MDKIVLVSCIVSNGLSNSTIKHISHAQRILETEALKLYFYDPITKTLASIDIVFNVRYKYLGLR